MERFVRFSVLTIGILTWVLGTSAMAAPSPVPASSHVAWVRDIPPAFILLTGVIALSGLDWLYLQFRKQRAYQRLQRVVALERMFYRKSHNRCPE